MDMERRPTNVRATNQKTIRKLPPEQRGISAWKTMGSTTTTEQETTSIMEEV